MATPLLDKELLAQLFSGESSQAAWKEFLLRYSNLFLKIIWQLEQDRDVAMDRYLFVCEKLAAKNFLILHKFNPELQEHTPKLSTWLTIVVRNICVEGHRSIHGRRRYPQALLRLSSFDREVFELSYWKGYSIDEVQQHIKARRNGSATSVRTSLRKIDSALTGASKKALRDWNDPVIVSLEEETAIEQDEHADDLVEWFETSSRRLTDQERLAIRLRFWEDLTAAEIGSILKIQPLRKVYTLLENSLKKLQYDARREFAR